MRRARLTSPAALVLAALAALIAVSWIGSLLGRELQRPPLEPAGPTEQPPLHVQVDLAEPEQEEAESSRAPSTVPTRTAAVSGPRRVAAIEGSVVVRGADGVARAARAGTIRVSVWQGESGRLLTIPIEAGRFALELEAIEGGGHRTLDGRFRFPARAGAITTKLGFPRLQGVGAVRSARSEAARQVLKERHAFGVTDVVVEVRQLPEVLLNVVDAATGLHLDGVEVLAFDQGLATKARHPAGEATTSLVLGGTSPVSIRIPSASRIAGHDEITCLVRSAGHAWTRIRLDVTHGGERTIELGPAADLEVEILGKPAADARLRLRVGGQAAPVSDRRHFKKRWVQYRYLAPGAYDVSLEIGRWATNSIVLASGTVDLVAGETARITLTANEAKDAASASASGVLVLPPAWGIDRPRVSFRLLGPEREGPPRRALVLPEDLRLVDGTDDTYAFEVGPLQTGRYSMMLGELWFAAAFDLGPEGRDDLRIEVPPPVDVQVSVLDVETGRVADVSRVTWMPAPPEGTSSGRLHVVEREPGSDRFHLRVPEGSIQLWVNDPTHSRVLETFAVREGTQLTVETRAVASATVELRDGQVTIPWPENVDVSVRPVDGTGEARSSGRTRGRRWVEVDEPGRYRLAIPDVAGFLPGQLVEVDFVKGERREVVVPLVRAR
ncbi:MAG: hypothetical protein AAF957_07640 [Planctomycetota bacterium]